MPIRDRKIRICDHSELAEKDFRIFPIAYRGVAHSGLVYRFKGKVHGYLNQCVHMPRRLNCEKDTIFDEGKNNLRCSMHGIVYDAQTGQSISTLCNGEKLQPLRLLLTDSTIYVNDKRVTAVPD